MSLNSSVNHPGISTHPNASQQNGIGKMAAVTAIAIGALLAYREWNIHTPRTLGQFEPDAAAIDAKIEKSSNFTGFNTDMDTHSTHDVLEEFKTTTDEYKKKHICDLLAIRLHYEDAGVQKMIIEAMQNEFLSKDTSPPLQFKAAMFLAHRCIVTPNLCEYLYNAANANNYENPSFTGLYWASVLTSNVFESTSTQDKNEEETALYSTANALSRHFEAEQMIKRIGLSHLEQYANKVQNPEEAAKARELLAKCKRQNVQPIKDSVDSLVQIKEIITKHLQ